MDSADTPGNDDLVASSPGTDQVVLDTITSMEKEASINPTVQNGQEEIENSSRPKGVRFAILFISILAGDFFVGYVRHMMNTPYFVQPPPAYLLTGPIRIAACLGL